MPGARAAPGSGAPGESDVPRSASARGLASATFPCSSTATTPLATFLLRENNASLAAVAKIQALGENNGKPFPDGFYVMQWPHWSLPKVPALREFYAREAYRWGGGNRHGYR